MSNDLAARLVLQLIDNISGPAGNAAKGLKGLKGDLDKLKAGGASAEMVKLAEAMKKAEAESQKFKSFRTAADEMKAAAARFKAAQQAVVEAATKTGLAQRGAALNKEMLDQAKANKASADALKALGERYKSSAQNLKEMERSYKNAQREVKTASSEFLAQKDVFSSSVKSLKEMGIGLNEVAAAEKRVRSEVAATSAVMKKRAEGGGFWDRTKTRLKNTFGTTAAEGSYRGGFTAKDAVVAGSSWYALEMLKKGIVAGSSLQSELVNAKRIGAKDDEIQEALQKSYSVHAQNQLVSPVKSMQMWREARFALMNKKDALDLLPFIANAGTSFENPGDIAQLVKAAEDQGLTQNLSDGRFKAYMDAMVGTKALAGHFLQAHEMRDAAIYAKSSVFGLDPDFVKYVWPTFMISKKGARSGTEINSALKMFDTGFNHNPVGVAEMQKLGLLDDASQVVRDKQGNVVGYRGTVKNGELRARRPDQWATDVLDPALEKAGYHTVKQKSDALLRIGGTAVARDGWMSFIELAPLIKKNMEQIKEALGADESAALNKQDAGKQLQAFGTSLSSFVGVLTQPGMKDAASALSTMSEKLSGWSEGIANWQKDNPKGARAGSMALEAGALYAGWKGLQAVSERLLGWAPKIPFVGALTSPPGLTATALGGAMVAGYYDTMDVYERGKNAQTMKDAVAAHNEMNLRAAAGGPAAPDISEHEVWTKRGLDPLDYMHRRAYFAAYGDRNDRLNSGGSSGSKVDSSEITNADNAAKAFSGRLNDIGATVAKPQVDTGSLRAAMEMATQLKSKLDGINATMNGFGHNTGLHADHGLGGCDVSGFTLDAVAVNKLNPARCERILDGTDNCPAGRAFFRLKGSQGHDANARRLGEVSLRNFEQAARGAALGGCHDEAQNRPK